MSNPTPITVNENKASSKYIDRNPPLATDPDLNRKVVDYLAYLKEILNFSVATTGKRITDTSGYVNELVRTSNSMISTIYDTQNGLVTQISQQAGEITLMADKLDNIGVRNLFINTLEPVDGVKPKLYQQTAPTIDNYWTVTAAEHGVRLTKGGDTTHVLLLGFGVTASNPLSSMNGLKAGTLYTMSFDFEAKVLTTNAPAYWRLVLAAFDADEVRIQYDDQFTFPVTNGVKQTRRVVATFKLPDNAATCNLQLGVRYESTATSPPSADYDPSDYFELKNLKLEEGGTATAWTPAPEDLVGNDQIISKINIAPGTIKIQANKVDLQGYVTFTNLSTADGTTVINGGNIQANTLTLTSFDSTSKASLITGTTVKNQYYLSTSSSSATGGSWSDTIPAWSSGKYVWTRVRTTKTYASGTETSTNSTAVYDANLTTALSTAASASTAAGNAQTQADGALASTVSCYYRSTTSTTPTISTSTTIGTAVDTSNAWEYVMPRPKNGCYFFTCEKYTTRAGTVSFSTVRQMANTTYTSLWCSSSDATYIDGGQIYTGSITADRIKANETFTQKLYAQDLNITGGSVNITTASETVDKIVLNCGGFSSAFSPSGLSVSLTDIYNDEYEFSYKAQGLGMFKNGTSMGYLTTGSPEPTLVLGNSSASIGGNLEVHSTSTRIIAFADSVQIQSLSNANDRLILYYDTSTNDGCLQFCKSAASGLPVMELNNTGLKFYNTSGNLTATYPADPTDFLKDNGLSVASLKDCTSETVSTSGTTKTYTLTNGTYLITTAKYNNSSTANDGVWLASVYTGGTSHLSALLAPTGTTTVSISGATLTIVTGTNNERITITHLNF